MLHPPDLVYTIYLSLSNMESGLVVGCETVGVRKLAAEHIVEQATKARCSFHMNSPVHCSAKRLPGGFFGSKS